MNDNKLYVKTKNELKAQVSNDDIFCKDIGMKFGIIMCAKVIVHSRQFRSAESIPTSTGKITDVETDKGYKYLGVLLNNENTQHKIKDEIKQTYIKESNKY